MDLLKCKQNGFINLLAFGLSPPQKSVQITNWAVLDQHIYSGQFVSLATSVLDDVDIDSIRNIGVLFFSDEVIIREDFITF
jgi:hypothetical protein